GCFNPEGMGLEGAVKVWKADIRRGKWVDSLGNGPENVHAVCVAGGMLCYAASFINTAVQNVVRGTALRDAGTKSIVIWMGLIFIQKYIVGLFQLDAPRVSVNAKLVAPRRTSVSLGLIKTVCFYLI